MSDGPHEASGAGSGRGRSGSRSAPAAPRPPLGGWSRLYALVLLALALDVALLWLLTERYR